MKNINFKPIFGVFVGFIFFYIFHGLSVLNPTNYEWILSGGDMSQHFLGWHFFRQEEWHFPIGFIQNFNFPMGTSIIYTDSLPLFAIPLKLFSSLLPDVFQYQGIWILSCYLLQGFFSYILFSKFTDKTSLIILGICFFLASPIVAIRSTGHLTLTAHWIITISLILYFSGSSRKATLYWTILSLVSISVHFYFYGMIMLIYLAFSLKLCNSLKSIMRETLYLVIIVILNLIYMYIIGYFIFDANNVVRELGLYSADLLSFLLPNGLSFFLSPLGLPILSKWEGHNYFGLGLIFLVFMVLILLSKKQNFKWTLGQIQHHFFLIYAVLILFLMAISTEITFLNEPIYYLNYPNFVERILGIFRSSGRMFWPITYIVILFCFVFLVKNYNFKISFIVLLVLVSIQVIDFKSLYFNEPLTSKKWSNTLPSWVDKIVQNTKHIVFIPATFEKNDYIPFSFLAANHKNTINIAYLAREDYDKKRKYIYDSYNNFKSGKISLDTLYIIPKKYAKIIPKNTEFQSKNNEKFIYFYSKSINTKK